MYNRSQDISHKPGHEDESQEYSQHSLKDEPSLSLWSSIADTNEFWPSDYNETFETLGLDSFNYGSEPGVLTANHEYGEIDLPELPSWNYDDEEMERGDRYTVPGHGAPSLGPMGSQTAQGDVSMDASHAPLDSPNKPAPPQQATRRSTEPFEKGFAQFTPESLTDPKKSTNHLNISIPTVVISDTAIESVGEGKKSAVSELYPNTSSTTGQFDAKQDLGQHLNKSLASSRSISQLSYVNRYRPNNYEIAMHDREPPYTVISGIAPQLRTLAAENVNAFYADADLTTPNVATMSNTDEASSVKRRRRPTNLARLQIPNKTPPGLQHWQTSSSNAVPHSTFPNSLQTPKYPTPPSSFRGIGEYNQFDSACGKDDLPSTPAAPLFSGPVELPSPISPLPSNLSDAADGITRCPSCPDKVFTGTRENQKNNLQRHKRDVHNGTPRLECLVQGCTTSFAPGRRDNLIKHVRALHPYYPLPPSTKRKRKADSGFESC